MCGVQNATIGVWSVVGVMTGISHAIPFSIILQFAVCVSGQPNFHQGIIWAEFRFSCMQKQTHNCLAVSMRNDKDDLLKCLPLSEEREHNQFMNKRALSGTETSKRTRRDKTSSGWAIKLITILSFSHSYYSLSLISLFNLSHPLNQG